MSRNRRIHSSHASASLRPLVAMALALGGYVMPRIAVHAQDAPKPVSTDSLHSYHLPAISLVLPARDEDGVPRDRPVIVFAVEQGEADDPIDSTSLRVMIDSEDQTALFMLSGGRAWGAMSNTGVAGVGAIALGPHRVMARICSQRGVCGTTQASVKVVPGLEDAGKLGQGRLHGVAGVVIRLLVLLLWGLQRVVGG
jgi:hypothetical protein